MADIPYNVGRSNSSIRNLILMGGEERARAAERNAMMWQSALSGIGNSLGQGIATYGAQKQEQQQQQELKKRDASAVDFVSQWNGKDPQELYSGLLKIGGPDYAKRYGPIAQAMKSAPTEDPKSELQNLYVTAKGIENMDDALAARTLEGLKARFGPTLVSNLGVPEELMSQPWSPEHRKILGGVATNLGDVLGIKTEKAAAGPKVHEVGGALVDDTGKVVYEGKAKPEKANFDYRDMGDAVGVYQDGKLIRKDPKGVAPGEGGKEEGVGGFLSALERGDLSISDVPMKDRDRVLAAADAKGLDTRTAKQKGIDSDAEAVMASLSQLEDQAKKTITATTGPGAKIMGAVQTAGAAMGLAEETTLWNSQLAKLSGLARQMGERGTLTDRDIERVQALLPSIDDKVSVRDKKLADIREIIAAGLKQKVSSKVDFRGSFAKDQAKKNAELMRQRYGAK